MQVSIGAAQIEPPSPKIRLPSRECLAKGFCLRLKKSVVRIEIGSIVSSELVEGQLIHSPIGHLMCERFKLSDVMFGQHRVDAHERSSIDSKRNNSSNNLFEAMMQARHGSQQVVGLAFSVDTEGDFVHALGGLRCNAGILQCQTIGSRADF